MIAIARLTIAGLATAILTPVALAQWTSDASLNTGVGTTSAVDEQPKVAATSDGGCYVSWFSDAGFDVRLQRLDADGVAQWAANGILVADRGFSSTQDYDLAVDGSNNAVLAFRDDRFGGTRVTAQMIAPDGTTPWGANGVQFDDGAAFVAAPKVTVATDGDIFVGWSREEQTRMQKLDAAGAVQWVSPTILPNPENFLVMSDLNPSNDGSVIVSCVGYASFPSAKHLYAQRVDTDGDAVWRDWTALLDNDSLQFGNFPSFIPDGSGGGVFSWYVTSSLQCFVQRLLADGTEVFTHNGVAVSTNTIRERVSPSVGYNPITSETFVFWEEIFGAQYGIYGQKLDAGGVRQWGSAGMAVSALSSTLVGSARTMAVGCGAMVFFGEELAFNNDNIRGARVDTDGSLEWIPGIQTVGSAVSGKGRLIASSAADKGGLVSWVDYRSGSNVFAQRVNVDGTLGLPPLAGDATGDQVVNVDDLVDVIQSWGDCCGCPADVNHDGVVNVNDLVSVVTNWS